MRWNVLHAVAFCLLFHGGHGFAQGTDMDFRYLTYRDGLPKSSHPQGVVQDHLGRLWFAYDDGLFSYDGYEVRQFTADIRDSTALPELVLQALMIAPDGRLWIGTENLGFCIYDPIADRFHRYFPMSEGGPFPIRLVWSIDEDSEGLVWFSGKPGLVRCDPERMTFRHFQIDFAGIPHEDLDYFNTMYEAHEDPLNPDILWVATRAGLVTFSKGREEFTFHPMPWLSDEVGFRAINYLVMDLQFTDASHLWMTTWAGGIMHYNTETRRWARFLDPTVDQINDIGYTLTQKDSEKFWYSSRAGFGTVDKTNGKYQYLPTDQERHGGLKWSYFYDNHMFTTDSTLIVCGSEGISFSDDNREYDPGREGFKPFISKIDVNHTPHTSISSYPYLDTLDLESDENDLSITIVWPVFQDPETVMYRYRLEGYDEEWIQSGNARTVQYANLPGGKYTFRFASSSDGNTWIEGRTAPTVLIDIALWRHPLFITSALVVVGGLLLLLYYMRISSIRAAAQMQNTFNKRLAENEMRALRAQMNPHFMFNSLNSIRNYVLKEDTQAASKYLTKFSRLMRAILRNSEHKMVSLADELEALKLYVEIESMRFNEEFEYLIDVEQGIPVDEVFVPPLLIQPYVENAIWHGLMRSEGARMLKVQVGQVDSNLVVTVEDNGIGRKAAQKMRSKNSSKRKSMGMKITQDRIRLVKDTLGIDAQVKIEDLVYNGTAAGTRVRIVIPYVEDEALTGFSNHQP